MKTSIGNDKKEFLEKLQTLRSEEEKRNIENETTRIKLPLALYQKPESKKWKCMLIFQSPAERKEEGSDKDELDNPSGMIKWFSEKSNFTEFQLLFNSLMKRYPVYFDKKTITKPEDMNIIPKYFYITDSVKVKKNDLKGLSMKNWINLLKEEIEIVNPKLILSFGRLPWIALRKNYHLSPRVGDEKIFGNISKMHGIPYRVRDEKIDIDSWLIPLAFIVGRNSFLRNSYIDYLESGLNEIQLKM